MLSKEGIEDFELFKQNYLQRQISMLTEENLDMLETHCEKTIRFAKGKTREEHLIVLELLDRYKQLESDKQEPIEKLEDMQIINKMSKVDLEDRLIIGIDLSSRTDRSCLIVARKQGRGMQVINKILDNEAEEIYYKLTNRKED